MRKALPLLVVIGIFIAVYLRFGSSLNTSFMQKSTSREKRFTVNQAINTEKSKQIQIKTGSTALDLLQKTSTVVIKGDKENAFVVEINGRKAEESKKEYWAFYINGKMASIGAGGYKLKDGDNIEWKIETY